MLEMRRAAREDSPAIARLFLVSSDGLAAYIWAGLALPGETLEAAGARRYAREGVAFSYESCLIAEADGAVVGMAHSFPMEKDPDAPPETDPVLRPYAELEDDGSLYLSGLAVVEGRRGVGIGTALMEAVNREPGRSRCRGSASSASSGTRAPCGLYRRLGFRELDCRPLVPHPALHYPDGDAVLLAREAW